MKNKNGFTLVELSIVLVVVGLLISGVLLAQSMIQSAKINSFSKQIQQYDIAVSNFKTKFKHLPGDAPACGGNGDGYIFDGFTQDFTWRAEIRSFWNCLSIFQNVKENEAGYLSQLAPVPGISMPKTKIGDKQTGIVGVTTQLSVRQVFVGKAIYGIGGMTGNINLGIAYLFFSEIYPTISASDALAVDKKMDDGVANAGSVRATLPNYGGGTFGLTADNTAGSGCVMNTNAALYNINSTSTGPCGLSILMLATNEINQ
jgi:prepilin-type N-terminal cleavage/methylation domain-containing protein